MLTLNGDADRATGEAFPDAQVWGNDLSPEQPSWVVSILDTHNVSSR